MENWVLLRAETTSRRRSNMKSTLLISIFTVSLLATLAASAESNAAEQKPESDRYRVIDLGTLGGTFSSAFGVNRARRVGGAAQLPGGNQHAFLWHHGHMTDLGTLGGPNSVAGGPNGGDELAIESETATTDPLGEDFCGFGTHFICLGALWKSGVMTPLPTLGGNNGLAFTLNNRGRLIGAAENGVQDSSCRSPQVVDFEAVVWGPKGDHIEELRPLPGDSVGFALAINDHGQTVGSSGSCANTAIVPLAVGPHAVLWENGSPVDLGSLGGKLNNTAAAINDRTEVVGASDLSGDTTIHSFLWTKEKGMEDLGTIGSDVSSLAGWINNKGEVVGWSCDSNGICRAYYWENKVMTDLNSLIPADSKLYLAFAFGINDDGDIVGQAIEKSSGEVHAFLATPRCGDVNDQSEATDTQNGSSERAALSENVRGLLQQRVRLGGFGSRFLGIR
jgi:probable HAF family extracellular repeat protein